MGVKELSSHRDPPFLLWRRKDESQGAIMGVTDRGTYTNIYVGPRAQSKESKEESLLGHGKNPSSVRGGQGQRERPTTKSDTLGHSMEYDKY